MNGMRPIPKEKLGKSLKSSVIHYILGVVQRLIPRLFSATIYFKKSKRDTAPIICYTLEILNYEVLKKL